MISPDVYYTVQGWMISELGLKGNALAVYAIIYGFSQDGASEYAGSSSYLCEWLGCSKKTVLTTLADLTDRGLLVKRMHIQNGVKLCNYTAVRRPQKTARPGEKITPGVVKKLHQGGEKITPGVVKKLHQGGEKITPHNYLDNYKDNYIDNYKDINTGDADAPPAAPPQKEEKGKPQKGKKKKAEDTPPPEKEKHGEYGHVLLTKAEHEKLLKKHGEEKTAALIKYLDEYMEDKPKYKSASHYLAISRWVVDAVNEKARRSGQGSRPAGRGHAGPVGPNGIAIDPNKTDLDGLFT